MTSAVTYKEDNLYLMFIGSNYCTVLATHLSPTLATREFNGVLVDVEDQLLH